MEIINSSTGKIGSYFVGPKSILFQTVKLGEVIICIGREDVNANKPFIWLMGGIEQVIDYVSLARSQNKIDDVDATLILSKLDQAKSQIPKTAMARLASVLDMEIHELNEFVDHAQVFVSSPIDGIKDFSNAKPKWLPKVQVSSNVAGIH